VAEDKDKQYRLVDIIERINNVIAEAKKGKLSIEDMKAEINDYYNQGVMSDIRRSIELERCRRVQATADHCIKSLETQKKMVIAEIKKLDD
jgi:hypothetical protein